MQKDDEKSRQTCVEKMFMHIGNLIRYLLNAVNQVYKKNSIDYNVFDFHQKIMRMLAPPCQLMKLNQEEEDNDDWIDSNVEAKPSQDVEAPQMLKIMQKSEPLSYQSVQENKNSKSKEKKQKIFVGNNPTGVNREIKLYELQKGYFFQKSLKVMRHTKKFTQNYEQMIARKNDPNRIPKRRPKKVEQKEPPKQKLEKDKPSKKGRKLQFEELEEKVCKWATMQISKGKKLKKVDIRNQFRLGTGGKCRGSTGWCRRFLERHPQIKSWFKRSKILTQTNRLAKTEDGQKNGVQWLRPGEQEQIKLESVSMQQEGSSSQFSSQSFEENEQSASEYEKSNMRSQQDSKYSLYS